MTLILPLGTLVQVHWNGYFLHWCPNPLPQSSETLALAALARVSISPFCLPSPSPEGLQNMVRFLGDFLGEILRFPASGLGHPQNIRTQNRCKSFTKKSCPNPCKNPHKRILAKKAAQKKSAQIRAETPFKKLRSKNPCKKSVQKIRAEIHAKSPCKTNPCK